jgi:hypothetical protein
MPGFYFVLLSSSAEVVSDPRRASLLGLAEVEQRKI